MITFSISDKEDIQLIVDYLEVALKQKQETEVSIETK